MSSPYVVVSFRFYKYTSELFGSETRNKCRTILPVETCCSPEFCFVDFGEQAGYNLTITGSEGIRGKLINSRTNGKTLFGFTDSSNRRNT
jgi:hypothetical protein